MVNRFKAGVAIIPPRWQGGAIALLTEWMPVRVVPFYDALREDSSFVKYLAPRI